MTKELEEVQDKIMEIITEVFERIEHKFVSAQTAAEVSDAINKQLREGALAAFLPVPDELKFDYSGSDRNEMKLKPGDMYTAYVMYCFMNGIPLTFKREDCPERIVLGNGTILTYDHEKGQIGVQVPRPVDYIEINFVIDADGNLGGVGIDKNYKAEEI